MMCAMPVEPEAGVRKLMPKTLFRRRCKWTAGALPWLVGDSNFACELISGI